MNVSSSVSSIASSIFSKLDTKSQGYLDKADLQKAFEGISSSDSSSSDIDDIFSKMDSDADGKITESELTTSINNLVGQLNSQMNSGRAGMPPPPGGMPPPPPPSGEDEGYTKDQLTEIASSTTDSKLSGLMTSVAANFEAADTNQDGKVNSTEAMAYQRSQESSSSSTSSDSASTAASSDLAANTLLKIAQLIHAYGFDNDNSSSSSITASA